MNRLAYQHQAPLFHRNSLVKRMKVFFPVLAILSIVFLGGLQGSVYARQDGGASPSLVADQGTSGIPGYVVGSADVAAYACPDVNTAKCPVKLTLKPGTLVLIVDNVLGSNVPGSGNAWRKIYYQGLYLYVPMRFISISPSANAGPDISLVQTSYENNSNSSHNFPSNASFSTAPASAALPSTLKGVPWVCPGNLVLFSPNFCCPPGYSFNGSVCIGPTVSSQVTWYTATDGRINGGAGDRIAVYCRRSGRIEVWSINDSLGHFLVSFNHIAVDAAGKAGFSVAVGTQGVVTIGGDGHGQYWVALHGGPSNAGGTGDFAKTVQCYVP